MGFPIQVRCYLHIESGPRCPGDPENQSIGQQGPCWPSLRKKTSRSSKFLHRWKHFPRYWPFVRGIHRAPVPQQRPMMRGFGVFFDLRLKKRLSKHSSRQWFFSFYLQDQISKQLYFLNRWTDWYEIKSIWIAGMVVTPFHLTHGLDIGYFETNHIRGTTSDSTSVRGKTKMIHLLH